VKIGGEGLETRVIDGILQTKAKSAMLRYLNAPSPFTKDGWFNPEHLLEKSNALGITSLFQEGTIEVLTVIDVYELRLELISREFLSAQKDMLH
jgi:hypothetical protein